MRADSGEYKEQILQVVLGEQFETESEAQKPKRK